MLTSNITTRDGRTLTLMRTTGAVHAIPQHSPRRFFVVKLDGQEYTDLHSTTQQAATECAFGHNPAARSIVVRAPR